MLSKTFTVGFFEMSVLNIIKMGHPTLRKKAKKVLLKDFTKIKKQIGLITGIFIFLYGFFRFFIEFYREPDSQLGFLYLNLTLGQMLCFIMLIIGIVIIVNSLRKPKII